MDTDRRMSATHENPEQLSGWKQIGAYLGRGPRAVQRWERQLGLPVHRLRTQFGVAVYAFKHEIDEWRRQSESWETGTTSGPSARLQVPTPGGTDRTNSGSPALHELVASLSLACLALRAQLEAAGMAPDRAASVRVEGATGVVEVRFSVTAAPVPSGTPTPRVNAADAPRDEGGATPARRDLPGRRRTASHDA